jgi:proline iminopeptidase
LLEKAMVRSRSVVVLVAAALLFSGCRTAAPADRAGTSRPKPSVSGTVMVGGVAVPYVTEGDGRPCVVYSLLEYHRRVFSDRFKGSMRCTFVQGRIAIPEAPTEPPFTIDAAVADLEAVRSALGLTGFVLVGHSVQSVVALAYAKRYPQHVIGVIAVGSVPEISPRLAELEEAGWAAKATPERKAKAAAKKAALTEDAMSKLSPGEQFVAMIVADGPKRWFDADFDERPLATLDRFNAALIMQLFGTEYRLLGEGERYATPVLLAEGRLDWDFGGEALWAPYRDRFRDLTLRVFERSGHVPQLEEAAQFDAAVEAWLVQR